MIINIILIIISLIMIILLGTYLIKKKSNKVPSPSPSAKKITPFNQYPWQVKLFDENQSDEDYWQYTPLLIHTGFVWAANADQNISNNPKDWTSTDNNGNEINIGDYFCGKIDGQDNRLGYLQFEKWQSAARINSDKKPETPSGPDYKGGMKRIQNSAIVVNEHCKNIGSTRKRPVFVYIGGLGLVPSYTSMMKYMTNKQLIQQQYTHCITDINSNCIVHGQAPGNYQSNLSSQKCWNYNDKNVYNKILWNMNKKDDFLEWGDRWFYGWGTCSDNWKKDGSWNPEMCNDNNNSQDLIKCSTGNKCNIPPESQVGGLFVDLDFNSANQIAKKVLTYMNLKRPKTVIITNNESFWYRDKNGTMGLGAMGMCFENWNASRGSHGTLNTILLAWRRAAYGSLHCVHTYNGNKIDVCTKAQKMVIPLAAFLLIAQKFTYFSCMQPWCIGCYKSNHAPKNVPTDSKYCICGNADAIASRMFYKRNLGVPIDSQCKAYIIEKDWYWVYEDKTKTNMKDHIFFKRQFKHATVYYHLSNSKVKSLYHGLGDSTKDCFQNPQNYKYDFAGTQCENTSLGTHALIIWEKDDIAYISDTFEGSGEKYYPSNVSGNKEFNIKDNYVKECQQFFDNCISNATRYSFNDLINYYQTKTKLVKDKDNWINVYTETTLNYDDIKIEWKDCLLHDLEKPLYLDLNSKN